MKDVQTLKREHPALEIFPLFSVFVDHCCPPGSVPRRLKSTYLHADPDPQHWY